jgi:radical S-adenosyl methionine domain-containing protein 2
MSPMNPLSAINFHLYKPCNERCLYCFATFPEVRGQLSNADAERLVGELASHGLQKLTFVGGEPTLHPALPRLLRVARQARVVTALVTNGARLAQLLRTSAGDLDWVGLSIDSGREDVQQALGRGHGDYVRRSVALLDQARTLGLRTKLNTVVTALNWEEDMSALVRQVRPERWKVFQVLPVGGQNDGKVESLLISAEQFGAFVARHAHLADEGLEPVPEDNAAMTGSYLMVDPLGRFFDNVGGRLHFSQPILEVGVEAALAGVRFSFVQLERRGGVYPWAR